MASEKVTTDVVLAQEFPELARRYQVSSVPLTVFESEGTMTSVLGARPEASFREALVEADGG